MSGGLHTATRVSAYPPKHLCQLSFEQRYNDREANAGGDQVKQGGLWTHRT